MSELFFHHPLAFRLGHSRMVTLRSVEQALVFLDKHWPVAGQGLYLAARAACLEALIDPRKVRQVRYALVQALQEAGLEPIFAFEFMSIIAGCPRHAISI